MPNNWIRPSIDVTLMTVALAWEMRSTCARNRVGAVIAKDGRHIGSGYNGAPARLPHCEHSLDNLRILPRLVERNQQPPVGCRTAIHAEANAISYSARHGVSIEGATIYTTLSPCYGCAQLAIASGLARVVYNREYRDPTGLDLLVAAGLTVDRLEL